MEKYSSIDEAIAQVVIPALGEFAADYDAEAIAREAFEGVEDGLSYYFVQREDVDFWEIAAKHDISEGGEQ